MIVQVGKHRLGAEWRTARVCCHVGRSPGMLRCSLRRSTSADNDETPGHVCILIPSYLRSRVPVTVRSDDCRVGIGHHGIVDTQNLALQRQCARHGLNKATGRRQKRLRRCARDALHYCHCFQRALASQTSMICPHSVRIVDLRHTGLSEASQVNRHFLGTSFGDTRRD